MARPGSPCSLGAASCSRGRGCPPRDQTFGGLTVISKRVNDATYLSVFLSVCVVPSRSLSLLGLRSLRSCGAVLRVTPAKSGGPLRTRGACPFLVFFCPRRPPPRPPLAGLLSCAVHAAVAFAGAQAPRAFALRYILLRSSGLFLLPEHRPVLVARPARQRFAFLPSFLPFLPLPLRFAVRDIACDVPALSTSILFHGSLPTVQCLLLRAWWKNKRHWVRHSH